MTLSIMTLSIMTISIMAISIMTLSKMSLAIITLRITTFSIVTLRIIIFNITTFIKLKSSCDINAECHDAKCYYAKCRSATTTPLETQKVYSGKRKKVWGMVICQPLPQYHELIKMIVCQLVKNGYFVHAKSLWKSTFFNLSFSPWRAWLKRYRILSSIVRIFIHWKWSWNIPCALYMEGSWERVYDGFYDE